MIDPATFKVVGHFPVGAVPHHITPAWDMKQPVRGQHQSNSLTQIDPQTGKPERTIAVTDPYNLYFTPDGTQGDRGRGALQTPRLPRPAHVEADQERADPLARRRPPRLLGRRPLPDRVSTEYSGSGGQGRHAEHEADGEPSTSAASRWTSSSPRTARSSTSPTRARGGVSVIDPKTMKEVAFLPTGAGAHGLRHQPRCQVALRQQPNRRHDLGDRPRRGGR